MKFSHAEREQVFTILSEKRSICDDCQQELVHLIMCKMLVMGWKYFKLHLNFRRNTAKLLCAYIAVIYRANKGDITFGPCCAFKFYSNATIRLASIRSYLFLKGAESKKRQAELRFGFSSFNSYLSTILLTK